MLINLSKDQLEEIKEKQKVLFSIDRAPSQFKILLHLISTGKTMTVKEISSEIDLTSKATERAVAKLLNKKLIQRSIFRDGAYIVDNKELFIILLLTVKKLYEVNKKK